MKILSPDAVVTLLLDTRSLHTEDKSIEGTEAGEEGSQSRSLFRMF